jgi:hypothetical protein
MIEITDFFLNSNIMNFDGSIVSINSFSGPFSGEKIEWKYFIL